MLYLTNELSFSYSRGDLTGIKRESVRYKARSKNDPEYDEMCKLYDEEVKEKDAAVKDALEMISDTKAAIAELNTEIDGLKVAAQNESAIPHHVSHLQQQTTSSLSNNGDTATTSPDEDGRQENGENGATQRTLLSVAGRSVRVHETYDENTLQQQFADDTQEA
jgi:hypothetical protein